MNCPLVIEMNPCSPAKRSFRKRRSIALSDPNGSGLRSKAIQSSSAETAVAAERRMKLAMRQGNRIRKRVDSSMLVHFCEPASKGQVWRNGDDQVAEISPVKVSRRNR